MYTSIIGNANNDLKNIQAILVTLRDNGKHSAIPPTFREYEPTYGSTLDSIVRKWEGIGISPIAATSACFLGKKPSNRSEVDAITLFHQMLEMVKSQEDLNMGAKKFVDKCITYIKTFVQFAARDNHKVLGFYTRVASTVWGTCGTSSRISTCLIPSRSRGRSRWLCFVIIFENSRCVPTAVIFVVSINQFQRTTRG